jgi:hypothetical protein
VYTISSLLQGDGSIYVVSDGNAQAGGDLPPRAWLRGQGGIPASPGVLRLHGQRADLVNHSPTGAIGAGPLGL